MRDGEANNLGEVIILPINSIPARKGSSAAGPRGAPVPVRLQRIARFWPSSLPTPTLFICWASTDVRLRSA